MRGNRHGKDLEADLNSLGLHPYQHLRIFSLEIHLQQFKPKAAKIKHFLDFMKVDVMIPLTALASLGKYQSFLFVKPLLTGKKIQVQALRIQTRY